MADVTIKLTMEQVDAVANGLDLSNRIMMGQLEEIALLARTGRLNVRVDRESGDYRTPTEEEIEKLETHLSAIALILGHERGSFGIGSPGVPIEAKRQYEVLKILQKVSADHRQPHGKTTHHDGIIVRYTKDPMPTAKISE